MISAPGFISGITGRGARGLERPDPGITYLLFLHLVIFACYYFCFNTLLFNSNADLKKDAHVKISHPDQAEETDQVTSPVGIQ